MTLKNLQAWGFEIFPELNRAAIQLNEEKSIQLIVEEDETLYFVVDGLKIKLTINEKEIPEIIKTFKKLFSKSKISCVF